MAPGRGIILVLAAGAGAYFARAPLLSRVGDALVAGEQPQAADVIAIHGGDEHGARVRRAVELHKQGYAGRLAMLDIGPHYGHTEAELARDYAVSLGLPPGAFVRIPLRANSTQEEVRLLAAHFRSNQARRVLAVTSEYHSARTRRVWRNEAPELTVRVIAADDDRFDPRSWWRDREGQKVFFFEAAKTLAYAVGL